MNKKKGAVRFFGVLLVAALISAQAFAARDLGSAAQSAVSTATTVAKIASVLGIICGAIIYQIPGAVMFARSTLIGGIIGAVLSFGGGTLIGLLQSIFGS